MDESITVRISGEVNSLTSTYSPVIKVNGNSEIALVRLHTSGIGLKTTNNKICINELNNSMNIADTKSILTITIESGFYTIDEINNRINQKLNASKQGSYHCHFNLYLADDPSKCRLYSNKDVMFDVENSLANVLGFEKKKYDLFVTTDLYHQSEKIKYEAGYNNSIKVVCNIVKGSFDNGQHSRSIYEFFPQQSVGTEIVESPINLIYHKLKTAVIKKIKIELVNEENKPIKNWNEKITVILHIRPIKS